jgi:DNA-binding GntR family transcriptional regulator
MSYQYTAGHKRPKRKPLDAATAPRRLSGSIYEELRERICVLRYPPGAVLREHELATEFGVSRTPVRQVLQRLEVEGFVETRNGVGTIVTGVDFKAFRDVYDVRLRLAEMLGQLSPRPPNSNDIAVINELLGRAQRLYHTRDTAEFWRINHERQKTISSLTNNLALRQAYDLFYYQTARIWFRLAEDLWTEQVDSLCSELSDVIRAMKFGDTQAVAFVERNHLSFYMIMIGRFIGGQPPLDGAEEVAS